MDDPRSLIGLTSLPLLVALLAALPFSTGSRSGGPAPMAPPLPDSVDPSGPPSDGAQAVGFRKGRELVSRVRGRAWDDTLRSELALEVLVALVPDPDQSSLDWIYDGSLASIRRAMERANYTSDLSWFPDPGRTVRLQDDLQVPEPEALPGVLVFRGGQGTSTDSLAVVYLVGEVPTTGVHKPALRTALREASLMESGDTLRILGPTFSGSAPSLRAVLTTSGLPGRGCRHVRIVTGSATSASNNRLLRGPVTGCSPGPDGAWTDSLGISDMSFGATVHRDGAYLKVFQEKVLGPLGLRPDEVALLTESNTGYGQSQSFEGALLVPFPLNIATVRGEYARNPAPTEGRDAGSPERSPRLPLSLRLRSRPREVPPPRSRLTAPALDLVIGDIVATLKAHRIRAVGILASDVRDKIFLADLMRRELRDVLVFTFEGNALFVRPDLSSSLRNMVVVSTYPLILENVAWTEHETFLPFTNEVAAGVFNAAVILLGRPFLVQEYRAPLTNSVARTRPPVWVTTVARGGLLPLALADADSLGMSEDLLPTPAPGRYAARVHAPAGAGLLDWAAAGMGLLLVVGGVVLVASMVRRLGPSGSPEEQEEPRGIVRLARSWLGKDVLPRGAPWQGRGISARRWSDLDALAAVVALVSFFAPLALLNGLAPGWERTGPGRSLALGVLLSVELTVVVALLALSFAKTWSQRWGRDRGPRTLAPLQDLNAHGLALVLGTISIVYTLQILEVEDRSPVLFGLYRFRTLRFETGASGLLVFLLAAVGILLALGWHRDRRRLLSVRDSRPLESLAEQLKSEGDDRTVEDPWNTAFTRAGDAMQKLRDNLEVRVPLARGLAVVAGVGVLLALLVYLFRGPGWVGLNLRTIDDLVLHPPGLSGTTLVVWAGLVAGMVAVVGTVAHLLAVWHPFRDFLSALSEVPVAPPLGRVPDRLRTLGRLHLFDPPAADLGRALAESGHETVWRTAQEHEDRAEFAFLAEELPEGLPDLGGEDSPDTRHRAMSALFRVLRRVWAEHPDLVWGEGSTEEPPSGKETLHAWLRRAEDVTAVEVVRYVDWVLRNLRRIALLLLFLILFTTFYLEAFPFPHHALLTTTFMILVVVGVVTVVMLMAQLSQDDTMSRINGTQPGKISWNRGSLVSALVFVTLPVLSLLATEVAPVGRTLFGWVQDLLRLLSSG